MALHCIIVQDFMATPQGTIPMRTLSVYGTKYTIVTLALDEPLRLWNLYPQYTTLTDTMSFHLQISFLSTEPKIEDVELKRHKNKVVMWIPNLPILHE